METPYMGVDSRLNRQIRAHFAAANNRFANRIWGCPWDQIFNPDTAAQSRIPSAAEQQAIDQAVRRIRRRLVPPAQRLWSWLPFPAGDLGRKKDRC